jgi:hypothetical protein
MEQSEPRRQQAGRTIWKYRPYFLLEDADFRQAAQSSGSVSFRDVVQLSTKLHSHIIMNRRLYSSRLGIAGALVG